MLLAKPIKTNALKRAEISLFSDKLFTTYGVIRAESGSSPLNRHSANFVGTGKKSLLTLRMNKCLIWLDEQAIAPESVIQLAIFNIFFSTKYSETSQNVL